MRRWSEVSVTRTQRRARMMAIDRPERYDTNTRCAEARSPGQCRECRAGSDVRPKGRAMAMDLAIREADSVKIRFAEAGQGGSETAVLTSPGRRACSPSERYGTAWPSGSTSSRSTFRVLVSLSVSSTCCRRTRWGPSFCSWSRSGTWARCISSPLMLVRQPPCGRLRMIPRSCAAWRSAAVQWLSHCRSAER